MAFACAYRISFIIGCLFISLGMSAYAEMIKSCSSIDLRVAKRKTLCITSKGFLFQLERKLQPHSDDELWQVWKDVGTGYLWSDSLYPYYDHYQAQQLCQVSASTEARVSITHRTFNLPSVADYQVLEKHGGREVLSGLKDRVFWTADTFPYDPAQAFVYYGNNGKRDYAYRNSLVSVRCVAK